MKKITALPDAGYLRSCFSYSPSTGELLWRRRPRSHFATTNAWGTWNSRYANTRAGWAHNGGDGYRGVSLDAVEYLVHRLIWKMMTGAEPTVQIDHINRDGTDNRWDNLRDCTPSENSFNHRVRSQSKTGVKGVRHLPGGRFGAYTKANGKFLHLGSFATIEEAAAARNFHARAEHAEFFSEG